MEILFFILSLILTIFTIYGIGRSLYSHKELIRAYCTSEFLVIIHALMGLLLLSTIFIFLCTFNNTFWHLPYYFTN